MAAAGGVGAPRPLPRFSLEAKSGFVRWLWDLYGEEGIKEQFAQLEGNLIGGALTEGSWGRLFWTAAETRQLTIRQNGMVEQLMQDFQTDPLLVQRYVTPLGDQAPSVRQENEDWELQAALRASLAAGPPGFGGFGASSSSSSSSSGWSAFAGQPPSLFAPAAPRRGSLFGAGGPWGAVYGQQGGGAGLPPPRPSPFGGFFPPAPPGYGRYPAFVPRVAVTSLHELVNAILDLFPVAAAAPAGAASATAAAIPETAIATLVHLISVELRRWFTEELPTSAVALASLRRTWAEGGRPNVVSQVLHYFGAAHVDFPTVRFAIRFSTHRLLQPVRDAAFFGPPTTEQRETDRMRGLKLFFVRSDVLPFVETTVTNGNCFFDSVRRCCGRYNAGSDALLPVERKELLVDAQRQYLETYYTRNFDTFVNEVLPAWAAQASTPQGALEYKWVNLVGYNAAPDKREFARSMLQSHIFLMNIVYADNSMISVLLPYYSRALEHDVVLHIMRNGPDFFAWTFGTSLPRLYPAKTRLHFFVEYANAHYRSLYLQIGAVPYRRVFTDATVPVTRGSIAIDAFGASR